MAQTYYPHPELKPLNQYPNTVRARIAIERKICRKTIRLMKAAGLSMRVHSGEEWETRSSASEAALMRAMFNLDDAWLVISKGRERLGWVRFVFGNDGYDVVSDYTLAPEIETVMNQVNEYADRFDN